MKPRRSIDWLPQDRRSWLRRSRRLRSLDGAWRAPSMTLPSCYTRGAGQRNPRLNSARLLRAKEAGRRLSRRSRVSAHLADAHNNFGELLALTGRSAEAEAQQREALVIRQKLADDYPAVAQFRSKLAGSRLNIGIGLAERGESSKAEAEFRRALALYQKLAEENPTGTEYRTREGACHDELGRLLVNMGNPSAAEAEFRTCLDRYKKLVDENPTIPAYLGGVASASDGLADVFRSLGRPAEARDGYERAITIRESLAAKEPGAAIHRSELASSLRRRGMARRNMGDLAGAAADARRRWSSMTACPRGRAESGSRLLVAMPRWQGRPHATARWVLPPMPALTWRRPWPCWPGRSRWATATPAYTGLNRTSTRFATGRISRSCSRRLGIHRPPRRRRSLDRRDAVIRSLFLGGSPGAAGFAGRGRNAFCMEFNRFNISTKELVWDDPAGWLEGLGIGPGGQSR